MPRSDAWRGSCCADHGRTQPDRDGIPDPATSSSPLSPALPTAPAAAQMLHAAAHLLANLGKGRPRAFPAFIGLHAYLDQCACAVSARSISCSTGRGEAVLANHHHRSRWRSRAWRGGRWRTDWRWGHVSFRICRRNWLQLSHGKAPPARGKVTRRPIIRALSPALALCRSLMLNPAGKRHKSNKDWLVEHVNDPLRCAARETGRLSSARRVQADRTGPEIACCVLGRDCRPRLGAGQLVSGSGEGRARLLPIDLLKCRGMNHVEFIQGDFKGR